MNTEEVSVCPQCREEAVTFDLFQGISACENCGRVLEDSELVNSLFQDNDKRITGTFVEAKDTGVKASGKLLHLGGRGGQTVQRARPKDSSVKSIAALQDLASKLALPQPVSDQAKHFLEQLHACLTFWHHDMLVGSAAYTAIRVNELPLTLLDVSNSLQCNMFILGRRYHDALQLLNIAPPAIKPVDLLERSLDRILASGRLGGLGGHQGEVKRAILDDARDLMIWMDTNLLELRHPMSNVGAAIVLAAEINKLKLSTQFVSSIMYIWKTTLDKKIAQVKERWLKLAELLPYNVTVKNVCSHAHMIMRMTHMLSTSTSQQPAEGNQMPEQRVQQGDSAQPGTTPAAAEASQPHPPHPPGQAAGQRVLRGKSGGGKRFSKSRKKAAASKGNGEMTDGECHASIGSPGSPCSSEEDREEVGEWVEAFDTELQEYVRTDEEVELYRELFEARIGEPVVKPVKRKR